MGTKRQRNGQAGFAKNPVSKSECLGKRIQPVTDVQDVPDE